MARIESFRAKNDIPSVQDLEHQFLNPDSPTISHESIKKYADLIAADFAVKDLIAEDRADKESQKIKIYIVDSLSDGKIIDAFFHGDYYKGDPEDAAKTRDEFKQDKDLKAAIARIRQALIEELRGRISGNVYIITEDYHRLYGGLKKGVVGVAYELKTGNEVVYKEPAFVEDNTSPDSQTRKDFVEADRVFKSLRVPPDIARHFRGFIDYDEVNNLAILEKRDFVTLDEYLRNKDDKYFSNFGRKEIVISLKAVRDCVIFAKYLAENGLMLQDIGSHNIGIEGIPGSQNKNGLLFDPEGLVKTKKLIGSRLGNNQMDNSLMLDYTEEYDGTTSPFEMVYQFGRALSVVEYKIEQAELIPKFQSRERSKMMSKFRKSANPYEKLYGSLDEIINKMTILLGRRTKPENRRIDLGTALAELNKIIEEFEKSKV